MARVLGPVRGWGDATCGHQWRSELPWMCSCSRAYLQSVPIAVLLVQGAASLSNELPTMCQDIVILKWGQHLPGEMCAVSAIVMMTEKAYYCDDNVLQCSRQTHTMKIALLKKSVVFLLRNVKWNLNWEILISLYIYISSNFHNSPVEYILLPF